jgi:hypothetical protein
MAGEKERRGEERRRVEGMRREEEKGGTGRRGEERRGETLFDAQSLLYAFFSELTFYFSALKIILVYCIKFKNIH